MAMPQQLKKAMNRRLNNKASVVNAPPNASSTNNMDESKVATFAKPGFSKSNLLQKVKGEADGNSNKAIQRRLQKK